MQIPDEFRKCVAFLAIEKATDDFDFVGTGFFVSTPAADHHSHMYFVTAKHVIEGAILKNAKLAVRVNLKSGEAAWGEIDLGAFSFHDDDFSADVAIARFPWQPDLDHLAMPIAAVATEKVMQEQSFGIGDEVFIAGLFHHHKGTSRNIPIIRVGNLAAMREERVETSRYGLMEAYLIECRSIRGLSGSPVFIHTGMFREIEGTHKQVRVSSYLLGVVHGHWNTDRNGVDTVEDLSRDKNVNTGIAIVVPAEKILEILATPEFVEWEQKANDLIKAKNAPTED